MSGLDPRRPRNGRPPRRDLVACMGPEAWRRWARGHAPHPSLQTSGPALGEERAVWVAGPPDGERVRPGSMLYVCSGGRLRCRAEISDVRPGRGIWRGTAVFYRRAPLVPVTLAADTPAFRGLRRRWWPRNAELPCPDWLGDATGWREGA